MMDPNYESDFARKYPDPSPDQKRWFEAAVAFLKSHDGTRGSWAKAGKVNAKEKKIIRDCTALQPYAIVTALTKALGRGLPR